MTATVLYTAVPGVISIMVTKSAAGKLYLSFAMGMGLEAFCTNLLVTNRSMNGS